MKLKEIERTVNIRWSPSKVYPTLLAAGTAGQQVDSNFSSSATLELFGLNLGDPSHDLISKVSIPCEHKFQKLAWSENGLLIGGCDGGLLQIYNVDKMLKDSPESLVSSNSKHNGPVSALDINPFQSNLLASGASDSEIYIWDLNNTTTPMAPGNKFQPFEQIQALAWNQQVQHILASTFSTRCVVWDLRKNEPILKLSDGQARIKWRAVAWHPTVPTQLCIASEDDQLSVVQLWDLRLAASPLVTMERHQKGVLTLSWCQQDPELLLSAGKDGRIFCWNPNNTVPGGEFLAEVGSAGQWIFDVAWCPRSPNLFASSSFDGRVSIYSVTGGTKQQPVFTSNKILDSFPGMESLSQVPVETQDHSDVPQLLPRPPKWMRRPIAARFGFGGKLTSIENPSASQQGQSDSPVQTLVHISQVVTDPDLVQQASELEDALQTGASAIGPEAAQKLAEHCRQRGENTSDQHQRYVWFFLKANFESDYRSEMLNLLGYRPEDVNSKVSGFVPKLTKEPLNTIESSLDHITDGVAAMSRSESTETEAEPSTDTSSEIQISGYENGLGDAVQKDLVNIPVGDDTEGLICQALICGHIDAAVELCLESGNIADALIIASAAGNGLLARVQQYHLTQSRGRAVSVLASAVARQDWRSLASKVSTKSWREALAAALTYSQEDACAAAELLGYRLFRETDPSLQRDAVICYLCSVSVDQLVDLWTKQYEEHQPKGAETISQLVELALLAKMAAVIRGRSVASGGKFDHILEDYASRLAAQGALAAALSCIEGVDLPDLRHRLQAALQIIRPGCQQAQTQRQQPQQSQQTQQTHQAQQNNWWADANRQRTSSYRSETAAPAVPTPPTLVPSSRLASYHHHHKAPQVNNETLYNTVQPLDVSQNWNASPYGAASPSAPPPLTAQSIGGPMAPLSALPSQMPPRPPSTGGLSGGITSRSKYIVDPSVQSGGYNNQYNPTPLLNQTFTHANPYSPAPSQPYSPLQSNAYSPASLPPGHQDPFAHINQQPFQTPSFRKSSDASGISNGSLNYPSQPQAVASKPAAPGWNDPPMPHATVKSQSLQAKQQEYIAPAPITHPLFGVDAPQNQPIYAPPGVGPVPSGYPPQSQPDQIQGYTNLPPVQPLQHIMPQAPLVVQQQQPERASPALPPIQKAPIPEEHVHMQTVFDALRAECAQQTNNAQIKRKLEDVQRKLESLYDLLRENRLSEHALSSLHWIVHHIQNGDYQGCVNMCANLASGTDFAAVAVFLPGLKVLLQTSQQLQVYLR